MPIWLTLRAEAMMRLLDSTEYPAPSVPFSATSRTPYLQSLAFVLDKQLLAANAEPRRPVFTTSISEDLPSHTPDLVTGRRHVRACQTGAAACFRALYAHQAHALLPWPLLFRSWDVHSSGRSQGQSAIEKKPRQIHLRGPQD